MARLPPTMPTFAIAAGVAMIPIPMKHLNRFIKVLKSLILSSLTAAVD